MTDPTTTDRSALREQLLDALDFSYCQGVGYATPEELLAAYDADRTPADRAALRDRIADVLRTTRRAGYEGQADHGTHRYDARCALCAGDMDALTEALAAAVLPVTTDQTADRAAVLDAEAELILKHCPDHGPQDQDGVWMDCHCAVADDMRKRAAELRRMADETQPAETEVEPGCARCGHSRGRHMGDAHERGCHACWDSPGNSGWNHRFQDAAGSRQDEVQPLPTPAETAPADESPHVYMDAVQDSAAWAHAFTKAGQMAEALGHVEAMERLLAVYRRAVGA